MLSLYVTVRGRAGGFAIDQVGSDGQNGESSLSISVEWLFVKFIVQCQANLDG
jgi:hypothetical protein